MATLLDTSALVVLLRRSPPADRVGTAEAAAEALRSSRALISSVTVAELVVGARDHRAGRLLLDLLADVPAVAPDREVARLAGRMGRDARAAGSTIPLPDLLIAATAAFLRVPLLTCDSDFARGNALARGGNPRAWRGFRLHEASVV